MFNLNAEQWAAVKNTDSKMLVLAGAGTGKTRVIVEKIKYLVGEGIDPTKIFAVTFTRNAAQEMKQRLAIPSVNVSTFHSLALKICLSAGVDVFEPMDSFDYDFLIEKAIQLFDDDPAYVQSFKSKVSYFLVDEFQDIDSLQYRFFKMIAGDHFTVVGDDDQTIYGFRGDSHNLMRLIDDYILDVVILTKNYRSSQSILNVANFSIKSNLRSFDKTLKSDFDNFIKPHVYSCLSDDDEAKKVVEVIKKLAESGSRYSQIAVLYRSRWSASMIQEEMKKQLIPFVFISESDDVQLGLFDSADSVNFSTIHGAKGKEWDNVLVVGCERDIFPLEGAALHDERCLFYVSVTRARLRLALFYANKRKSFGVSIPSLISPFISELPNALLIFDNLKVTSLTEMKRAALLRLRAQAGLID